MKIVATDDPHNPVYLPYLDWEGRYLHLYGGGGSGKSNFAAEKLLLRLMEERGHKLLCIRKVGRTIRKSQFALLKRVIEEWGVGGLFVVKETEMEVHCKATGGAILSSGVDNPEKLKSIDGITGIWIEEATEISEDEFEQINLRLRFPGIYNQIIFTYNPINVYHWLNQKIHSLPYRLAKDGRGRITEDELVAILKTTYRDNVFLDRAYIDQVLAKQRKGFWKTVYTDGDWGSPEHLIYASNWRVVEDPSVEGEPVYGLDFGFEVPTCLVQINFSGKRRASVRELLYETHLTNSQLIERLSLLIPEHHKNCFIYADHDMQRIAELEEAGYNVYPADKAVGAGLEFTRRFELLIDAEAANVQKEIAVYQNKLDRNGKPIDEPVKLNDHAMDAMRYAIYSYGKVYLPEQESESGVVLSQEYTGNRLSPLIKTF